MKVKFLHDYLGRETAMRPMPAGVEMELVHQAAIELIAVGVAKEIQPRQIVRQAKEAKRGKDT